MKKVTKAVIPAAGLGTRVLPATKAMPKGMLPIVDKPAIQYLVEEAVKSGITDILIILGRSQSIIEDHFDRSPELEEKLAAPGKEKMLEECLGISNLANIFFVRQKQTLGLGHAVSMAKAFTGDDPFVVIYGDDVIWGEDPVCAQLIRAYEEFGRPAAVTLSLPPLRCTFVLSVIAAPPLPPLPPVPSYNTEDVISSYPASPPLPPLPPITVTVPPATVNEETFTAALPSAPFSPSTASEPLHVLPRLPSLPVAPIKPITPLALSLSL